MKQHPQRAADFLGAARTSVTLRPAGEISRRSQFAGADKWASVRAGCLLSREQHPRRAADSHKQSARLATTASQCISRSLRGGPHPATEDAVSSTSERALRGRALRRGYRLTKSQFRVDDVLNHGLFRLIGDEGQVVLGIYYDASLDEIADYLTEIDARYPLAQRRA